VEVDLRAYANLSARAVKSDNGAVYDKCNVTCLTWIDNWHGLCVGGDVVVLEVSLTQVFGSYMVWEPGRLETENRSGFPGQPYATHPQIRLTWFHLPDWSS
jgi:hypothetical protein